MTHTQLARGLALDMTRGQRLCRDARKPEFTRAEYLQLYREHYRYTLALVTRYAHLVKGD